MDNYIIKSKLDFENFIVENLNYAVISNMTFDAYKKFVYFSFFKLNELKLNGLEMTDIESFVKNHYSNVTSLSDDADVLFERRFSSITEELIGFCPDPIFWSTDFDLYIKKWDKLFEVDWFRKV